MPFAEACRIFFLTARRHPEAFCLRYLTPLLRHITHYATISQCWKINKLPVQITGLFLALIYSYSYLMERKTFSL